MEDEKLSGELTRWAASHGAKIKGIAAHKFPGKGLGVIAERRLEAGETILEIPTSLIRTEFSLPKRIKKAITTGDLHDGSVNGLLALELAQDNSKAYALWRSTLPSLTDTKESMPLFWPTSLQDLLPPPALALLRKQQSKLHRDWTAVSGLYPNLTLEAYTHAWLLISTRTFYYTPPGQAAEDTPIADECLAIVPFGDYFNHSSSSSTSSPSSTTLKVNYSPTGYEFTTDAEVPAGAELFISYGSHTNDFLLVEYGFILPAAENAHDAVALDAVVLPLLSAEQKKALERENYLGNYVLNNHQEGEDEGGSESEVVCYRTTVALRLLCMPTRKWRRGLASGFDDQDGFPGEVTVLLGNALSSYIEMAETSLTMISQLDNGSASQRDMMTRRWDQILAQLMTVSHRIKL
ncbi:hypothetical protein H2200_002119 [Cladophialophora chaetospira]|uniref:SET domain-containing protein n=1 Tax=Cladophialophora chaetospira TaxID=386627 RepID=A0AA38XIZ9_9EURO|nr:hypothetical protein H2200_002119 [Cladophialophora chaetospira]